MLPEAFLARMQDMLGQEYPDYLASLERPLQRGLRLGRKGQGREMPFSLEPIPWEKNGGYYDEAQRPGKHPWHEAGAYYLQEPSAMAPGALLRPVPGERVLDLCAAPGGKATQLAEYLQGQGILVANEIQPKRAKILSRNIERMGIPNALVLNMHPEALARRFSGWFHRVLVDAPCSGEGMFRKEAAALEDWSPETVEMCANRQREILRSAAKMVRPGGYLCYSTCTFSIEENEGVMGWFLKEYPEFHPADCEAPWFSPSPLLTGGFRLWPHKLRGEGHFVMLLRRDGTGEDGCRPAPGTEPLPALLQRFLEDMRISLPQGRLVSFGETLWLAPQDLPALHGLRVLRPGLELGILKKGRFEPAHALALWLETCARVADYPADSPEIHAYLQGQTLPGGQNGWTLIRADGVSLGWAKGAGGQLKNHYPKGLRRDLSRM